MRGAHRPRSASEAVRQQADQDARTNRTRYHQFSIEWLQRARGVERCTASFRFAPAGLFPLMHRSPPSRLRYAGSLRLISFQLDAYIFLVSRDLNVSVHVGHFVLRPFRVGYRNHGDAMDAHPACPSSSPPEDFRDPVLEGCLQTSPPTPAGRKTVEPSSLRLAVKPGLVFSKSPGKNRRPCLPPPCR